MEADLWSLGVVLFVLLTGVPPFGADSDEQSFALTRRGEYPTDPLRDASTEARALVARLLTVLPAERVPAEVALRDPWLEVAAGPAGDRALRAVRDNLRALRARTRLKRAMNAAFVTTRSAAPPRPAPHRQPPDPYARRYVPSAPCRSLCCGAARHCASPSLASPSCGPGSLLYGLLNRRRGADRAKRQPVAVEWQQWRRWRRWRVVSALRVHLGCRKVEWAQGGRLCLCEVGRLQECLEREKEKVETGEE